MLDFGFWSIVLLHLLVACASVLGRGAHWTIGSMSASVAPSILVTQFVGCVVVVKSVECHVTFCGEYHLKCEKLFVS